MKRHGWRLAALAAAAALYFVCRRAYFVGFFNDDAFYLIGAKSLLQGRYVELNHPAQPPYDTYAPGYPLLLALWSLPFGLSPLSVQSLSILLTAGSVWLLWACLRGEAEDSETDAAAAAFALGPMTVSLSGVVLSEIPLIALTLGALLLSKRWWSRLGDREAAALGALGGTCALIRLSGAAILVALAAALALERRWRRAAVASAAGAAVIGPYLLRNRWLTGRAETRISEMLDPVQGGGPLELLASAARNAPYYIHEAFARALFRVPESWAYAAAAFATLGFFLAAWGLRRWGLKGWRKLVPGFLAAWFAVHFFWPYQSTRYLYPALPLLGAMLYLGASQAGRRLGAGRGLLWGAFALSLALALRPLSVVARASLGLGPPTAMNTPPLRTFAFIREKTPREAVFAAELDGQLYLLTGRRCVHLPQREGAFPAWLKANPVDHVLIFPSGMIMRRASGKGGADPRPPDELERGLIGAGFQPVFAEPSEGSAIWAIRRAK